MKNLLSLLIVFVVFGCSDDAEQRRIENAKDLKKKEVVFANINRAWSFNTQPTNQTAGQLAASWDQYRVFLNELSQKPQSTIDAFRKKAKTLSIRVKELNTSVPQQFNKPEIRSRISVLATKINSLNLYIGLDQIPDQKVIALISEINTELRSLQQQMAEIVRKSQIPKEQGEADMIRMLDTARAIPNVDPNVTKVKPRQIE